MDEALSTFLYVLCAVKGKSIWHKCGRAETYWIFCFAGLDTDFFNILKLTLILFDNYRVVFY